MLDGKGRFGDRTPIRNMQLLPTYEKMIYDSPSGNIDKQFRFLPNTLVFVKRLYDFSLICGCPNRPH